MLHIQLTNNENDIIQKYFKKLTLGSKFSLNLEGDVAYLESNKKIITSTDSIVEGIHLRLDEKPQHFAHKLLARNLSDIAAKGGNPVGYMLAIILPKHTDEKYIASFAEGLELLTHKFNCPLIGGDISYSNTNILVANITIFGEVDGKIPTRSNAKVGDSIYITGPLGCAFLGFNKEPGFEGFYLTPIPKLEVSNKIAKHANAMMDISDGLLADLQKMLLASNIGAEIDFSKILLPDYDDIKYSAVELVTFGDDYELLFTSSADIKQDGIVCIGKIISNKTLNIVNPPKNLDQAKLGYSYFN